jgi:CubicO group peptidase (beta-lactamase class C family)
MPAKRFRAVYDRVKSAIAEGLIPGAVVIVGRSRGPVHRVVAGHRAVRPRREPMTAATIFDLASLTKVMATAPLVVEEATRGRLRLADPLERHLAETRDTQVGTIPLHRLLTHTAGFVPDNPIEDYRGSRAALVRAIAEEPLESEPGTRFTYSDVGYILLQIILERRARRRLDVLADEGLFRPLKLRDTRFGIRSKDRTRTAPTTLERGHWLRGVVHDPRARSRALLGVGGHAGVFGTAADTARFCEMILGHGTHRRHRVLSEATVRAMTTDQCEPGVGARRGFGFDIQSPYSAPRGLRFSQRSFGHSGWTGVSLWIDPEADAYVVLLTNATHPDGHRDLKDFRSDVATAAAEGLLKS